MMSACSKLSFSKKPHQKHFMAKKTIAQHLRWWWETRVLGFFQIKLKKKIYSDFSNSTFEFSKKTDPLNSDKQKSSITVILNGYRRLEYLADQVKAIRDQSVDVDEIWLWYNSSEDPQKDVSDLVDRVVVSNTNWLFWGRFSLANMARTDYVALFDDDIYPERDWLKTCLETIENGNDGILGGSGVILPLMGGYSSKNKAGWNGQHLDSVEPVDLVGHAWFMKKAHLQYMWREEPYSWDNGEDIHLSYMALKHGGIKTFVPPHPEEGRSKWSCRPAFGKVVGRKNVATFKTGNHKNIRSEIVDHYRKDGWSIVEEQAITENKTFLGDLYRFNKMLKRQDNFSLVRFGDGEMMIINGKAIDLSEKCNGEHKYSPGGSHDEEFRQVLSESLKYQNDQYFVGLACRCCVGDQHCDDLRAESSQPETSLTWANIFVNCNYPVFLDSTVGLFKKRIVNIICHEKANINALTFTVKKDFRVGANAWIKDYQSTLNEVDRYIKNEKISDQVFLFCAGVLSNMLIYQLTKKYPQNTYIDLGSVFDDQMGLGQTRKYLKGSKKRLTKVCVW